MSVRILTRRVGLSLLLLLPLGCAAGVRVTENVGTGATAWLGTPAIATVANPSTATVTEGFNGGGGNTNLSQTFTVKTGDCTLSAISIYAGGGSGTAAGAAVTLNLYDLGTQTAPNPSPYTSSRVGGNLFGGGAGLSVSYSPQTQGILEFDFTGTDQVALTNGRMYAFELTGVSGTSPVLWSRGASDTYTGGAAYRNQGWINGSNARDFAMAVYAAIIESTNFPATPYGDVFHLFKPVIGGINSAGANPAAGLTSSGGLLYGTTANGGANGAGTLFSLSPDGSVFTSLDAFANEPDAANPMTPLAASGAMVFGTAFGGGVHGGGAVFAGQTNGAPQLIRSFTAVSPDNATNVGGASPLARVALSQSLLFGAASAGGASGNGAIFSLTTNGSTFAVLHDFTAPDSVSGTNVDGATPLGGVIESGGVLYGTASSGGAGGTGVVFAVHTNGSGFVALHSFATLDPATGTNAGGAVPCGPLALSNNVLFGTASAGGQSGAGTVFSVAVDGSGFVTLHDFSAIDPASGANADGAAPCAGLTVAGGLLYGAAPHGGAGGEGSIFSVATNGTAFRTLYSFSALNVPGGTNTDGALPVGDLLLVGDSLWATTFAGGPGGAGTIFKLPLTSFPAVATAINLGASQIVTLHFVGAPNSTNVIQAAPILASPASWTAVSTNVADGGGAWQFTETNSGAASRFYRSYAQ